MKKLLIGFLLALTFVACKDDDEDLQNMFRHKNDTNYPVKIIVYGEGVSLIGNTSTDTISIAPSDTFSMGYDCVGDFCKGSNTEPFRGLADSARIVFDGKKQLLFTSEQGCNLNILCRNAYKKEVEFDKLVLQFTIDNQLYEQSQEIK
jgi:hypothetical protein